MANLIVRLYEF